jgi:RHS repeat-associated protein
MYQNRVTLIGFVGSDAKAHTNDNRSLTTLSLATKSSYKKDGKYISHTEWHRCVVFGKLAEFAKTLTKGAHIQVEGELRSREYTFEYDSYGRRILNAAGNNVLYEGWNIGQELSGTTPVVNNILGGIDEFFSTKEPTTAYSPITDALGSVLAMTNSSGVTKTQYGYDPFGNTTSSGATNANAFQYTGRENDANGLYSYRRRYYSPQFGRFISEDPEGFAAGTNFYAYVLDSPTNLSDPFGLDPYGNMLFQSFLQGQYPGYVAARINGAQSIADTAHRKSNQEPEACSGAMGGAPVAFSMTGVGDAGVGLGPALSVSWVPSRGELFIAPGIGATIGHNIGGGVLIGPNPSAVLPGWGLGFGYNVTPVQGVQVTGNSSGTLAGNSFGIPGASGTLTYGFCVKL